MSRPSHIQVVGQTQIGHLRCWLGVGPSPGPCGRNFHLGVIEFLFSVIRMIVGSFQVLPSDVSLNGPNAFDSSNSAAGISALIDHFLQGEQRKNANVESSFSQVSP